MAASRCAGTGAGGAATWPSRRGNGGVHVLFVRELREGRLEGPYDDAAAELFACFVLMPEEEFRRAGDGDDDELAAHFGVPVEQVEARHRELEGW